MPTRNNRFAPESVGKVGLSFRVSDRRFCVQQGLCQLRDKLSYALQALRSRCWVVTKYETHGRFSLFPHFFRREKRKSASGDTDLIGTSIYLYYPVQFFCSCPFADSAPVGNGPFEVQTMVAQIQQVPSLPFGDYPRQGRPP